MINKQSLELSVALTLVGVALLVIGAPRALGLGPVQRRALAGQFEARVRQAAAKARRSVVSVRLRRRGRRSLDGVSRPPSRSGGSGIILKSEGFILTNDHVVPGDDVEVTFSNGRRLPGVVWGRDPLGDLAIVKVKAGRPLPAVELADSQKARVGQPVLAVGNALGLALDNGEPAVSFGILSGTHRFQGGARIYGDALQFDAPVNPGNSGGGLFDLRGRLLGVTGRISIRGSISRSVGVGFAVPVHQVKKVLPTLLAGRNVEHGFLGVRFKRGAPGPGVAVVTVVAGSPAEQAGLKTGDVLLSINGTTLDHAVRLQNLLSIQSAGEVLSIKLRRGLEEKTVKVTLVARRKPR